MVYTISTTYCLFWIIQNGTKKFHFVDNDADCHIASEQQKTKERQQMQQKTDDFMFEAKYPDHSGEHGNVSGTHDIQIKM